MVKNRFKVVVIFSSVLYRKGLKSTQPDIEVLKKLRKDYANNASGLTLVSQVIAINFLKISEANQYWR
ncbi:hypothetical protein M0D21_06415 [Aquimarina sp. D1M17]|nr:hypothetical protein [Aquimarina acroporae]